jgi:hypothetical protein
MAAVPQAATSRNSSGGQWWPADLGRAGAREDLIDIRYAYFPESHRLIVEDAGVRRVFDTGEHEIMRVTRCRYGGIVFTSQLGKYMLPCLVSVD